MNTLRHGPDRRRRPRHAPAKRGVVMVCVLVCLSVATTLVVAATAATLKQRQRVRAERRLRQVELLVDAGVRRAVARLSNATAYSGETWRPGADALPGFAPAVVRIDVARRGEGTPTVTVVAAMPADSPTPVRRTHTFRYDAADPVTPNNPNEATP